MHSYLIVPLVITFARLPTSWTCDTESCEEIQDISLLQVSKDFLVADTESNSHTRHGHQVEKNCGSVPSINGQNLQTLINENTGALMIGMSAMRCYTAALAAFENKGVVVREVNFDGNFNYVEGETPEWTWLHCTFGGVSPGDQTAAGTTMHSYVFVDSTFIGEGFGAAQRIAAGTYDSDLDLGVTSQSCDSRYSNEATIVNDYMDDTSNKVLVFGWINCPCTGIVQNRLASKSVCYEGQTWANPNSNLMKYLQCRQNDGNSHSFVYFRDNAGSWQFRGNGFAFEAGALADATLDSYISESGAGTTCEQSNTGINVYGEVLEECRTNPMDMHGSWQNDGKCTETQGGIHQICIEHLPADFSTATHQSAWSEDRANMRHCVCIGAWSLYMTDERQHPDNAREIMPHCRSIPETTLSVPYMNHWRDWNGYPANIIKGLNELVTRCLDTTGITAAQQCGLKRRFMDLNNAAQELADSPDLDTLRSRFNALTCPESLHQAHAGVHGASYSLLSVASNVTHNVCKDYMAQFQRERRRSRERPTSEDGRKSAPMSASVISADGRTP